MAKKTHIKVRLVPEGKPDSPFFYYVKKPAGVEKAKFKLKTKNWPATLTFFIQEMLKKGFLANVIKSSKYLTNLLLVEIKV